MGELNNAMCNYLSVPENFADYWNGAVFGGVQKIWAEDLEPYNGIYYTIPEGKSGKTESRSRDVIQKVAYSAKSAHPFRKNGAPFRLKLSSAQLVN